MSIPPVGSSSVQKTPSSDSVDNTSSQTNAAQDTSPQPKSEPLSDNAKGQILQESNISGQSRRSQLDTALEKSTTTQTDSLKAKEGPDTKGGPAFPKNADEMAKTTNEDLLKLAQQW